MTYTKVLNLYRIKLIGKRTVTYYLTEIIKLNDFYDIIYKNMWTKKPTSILVKFKMNHDDLTTDYTDIFKYKGGRYTLSRVQGYRSDYELK